METKIKTEYRLVGLSKPRSFTLNFLDTDRDTFWAKSDMSYERFNALWNYCKDNWDVAKIAIVECDGFYEDKTPKNPMVIEVKEWDKRYKPFGSN